MTGNTVNGSGNGARSGAHTLVLLAAPLNVLILRALADGPRPQAELRRTAGSPAATTLRALLRRLEESTAIEKQRRNRFPGALEYELTDSGRHLLSVGDVLDRWLDRAPEGPLTIGSGAAKAAIKALAEGWSTTMLRALAAGPRSLTELDGIISSLSYPSLERRLGAMRLADQLQARRGNGHGTPYAVTTWLRQGVAPLIAAARWERRNVPLSTPAIGHLDIETTFLLTMPLLQSLGELSGSCRLAAEIPNGKKQRLAGVIVDVRSDGALGSCTTNLRGHTDAWALGSPAAWLNALIDHDLDHLELGGDGRLARALVEGLHGALFEVPTKTF